MRVARMVTVWAACVAGVLTVSSSASGAEDVALELVASSTRQWTGVAVSREGRVFVSYPRWGSDVPLSVAEIKGGEPAAYPSAEWNDWTPDAFGQERFVCVQSLTVDAANDLWILDPANANLSGVVAGAAKLLKVDLDSNEVVRIIRFDGLVAPENSYLNDLRVDTKSGFIYITDSGTGALVVVDGKTGRSRRLLDAHPSTKAEDITVTIEDQPWLGPDGKSPRVHADGIALSPRRDYLYYQALTGRTMYRIPTRALRDPQLGTEQLEASVERVTRSGVADGIAFDGAGCLYLTALEESAINRLNRRHKLETVVQDQRLSWPDSLAFGADGSVYVTTAQIHLGSEPTDLYRLWKLTPPPCRR